MEKVKCWLDDARPIADQETQKIVVYFSGNTCNTQLEIKQFYWSKINFGKFSQSNRKSP